MNRQPVGTTPSIVAALAILAAPPLAAQDHLVPLDLVQGRLRESVERRQADLARVDRVLSTPLAQAAAATLGCAGGALRTAVHTLGDEELRDLAQRAELLETDPAAGLGTGLKVTLIVIGSILLTGIVFGLAGVSA